MDHKKDTRRQSITFDLSWKHICHVTQFSFFCACLEMTTKISQVLIWGLQLNFSKYVNSQMWNPHIMCINCIHIYPHIFLVIFLWRTLTDTTTISTQSQIKWHFNLLIMNNWVSIENEMKASWKISTLCPI